MSSIKISQLPELPSISANTSNTLFLGVDIPTQTTGKYTATSLAAQLYANNALTVGNNIILFSNTVAQFSGYDTTFLQLNMQNFNANGSGDFVITGDNGTNSNNYIDVGLNGSTFQTNYTVGSAFLPNDGYVYIQGPGQSGVGNLVIGTASSNTKIIFAAGGLNTQNVVGYIDNTGSHFNNVDLAIAANLLTGLTFTNTQITRVNSNTANLTVYTQSAYGQANTANTGVTNLNGQVNILQSNLSSNANSINALTVFTQSAYNTVNSLVISSNTANLALFTQSAYNTANNNANAVTSLIVINGVQNNSINSALTIATVALTKANAALANTSGTFAGDLSITGNTSAQQVNTANLVVVGTANVSGTLNVVGAVSMNATLVLANSNFSATEAALTISGSPSIALPSNDGYMIHISGKQNVSSRIVSDSYGANTYVVYAGRSARGNVTNPSGVKTGDILTRFSGNGFGSTQFAPLGSGRLDIVAAEDHTDTARGTQLQLWNTPIGSNTVTNIATFNGTSVTFTGHVEPQKGFVFTPRVPVGNQTAITIDYEQDSMIKSNLSSGLTISHTNFVSGKVVEVWLVNVNAAVQTITHGLSALNSVTNSTTFNMPGTSSAYLRFFSIDGDLANTFVTITHA